MKRGAKPYVGRCVHCGQPTKTYCYDSSKSYPNRYPAHYKCQKEAWEKVVADNK